MNLRVLRFKGGQIKD